MKKLMYCVSLSFLGLALASPAAAEMPLEMEAPEFSLDVEDEDVLLEAAHCELASKTPGVAGGLSIGKLCTETISAYERTKQEARDALNDYQDAVDDEDPAAAEAAARRIVAAIEELENLETMYLICKELINLTLGH